MQKEAEVFSPESDSSGLGQMGVARRDDRSQKERGESSASWLCLLFGILDSGRDKKEGLEDKGRDCS